MTTKRMIAKIAQPGRRAAKVMMIMTAEATRYHRREGRHSVFSLFTTFANTEGKVQARKTETRTSNETMAVVRKRKTKPTGALETSRRRLLAGTMEDTISVLG